MKLSLVLFIQVVSLMIQMISSYILHDPFRNESASEISIIKVKKSVTLKNKKDLWNAAVVHYEIDKIFNGTQRRLIKQGMRMWEESSCIRFIERNPEVHQDYVAITQLSCGCCYIENNQRNKGRSEMSLADGCEKIQIVLHELGHVLGFYHEHQHPDRDQWVKIEEKNIDQGYEPEFLRFSPAYVDTLGLPYDYKSVMHYPKDAYAYYDFLTTIIPRQAIDGILPKIGNKMNLSDGDVKATNLLYRCPSCGGVFYDVIGFIQAPISSNDSDSDVEYCQWRIVASKGERIILEVSTDNIFASHDCVSDFLEIRNGYSGSSKLLARYCGRNRELKIIGGYNILITYLKTTKTKKDSQFSIFFGKKCGHIGSQLVTPNNPTVLESPNYPFNYRAYDNCLWTFDAPEDHTIEIKFEFFHLEDSRNCQNDFVEVKEINLDGISKVIGRFCGNRSPWNLNLRAKAVSIQFVSDVFNNEAGFSAMIIAEPII